MCMYACAMVYMSEGNSQESTLLPGSWTLQGLVASTFTRRDTLLAKRFQLLSEQIKVVFMCLRLHPRSLLRCIAGVGGGAGDSNLFSKLKMNEGVAFSATHPHEPSVSVSAILLSISFEIFGKHIYLPPFMLITTANRPRLLARALSSHPLSHLITINTLKEDL